MEQNKEVEAEPFFLLPNTPITAEILKAWAVFNEMRGGCHFRTVEALAFATNVSKR